MRIITPFFSRARALLAAPFALLAAVSCGGGGGGENTTGPTGVALVEVTAPSTSLEVGAVMIVSVRYFDSKHTQLSGRTVTYASSNTSVASVDNSGTVTAIAVGSTNITATVSGTSGSVSVNVIPIPVVSIVFSPANPAVRQGETLTIVAQPVDAIGRPLSGRTVTWSSANPAIATISATGVATGIVAGSVYIRAESEGKRDSVSLRVKSLNAPAITGSSSAQLTPGSTGTLTGNNFGATPNDNEVYVNGAKAVVTAATTSSVSFTVPSFASLPCTATGPAQIRLVANADTAVTAMPLRMATPRSLAVGQSMLLTSQNDLLCNEFAVTGGRYLITAFNYAEDAAVKTSFQLLGASSTAGQAVAASFQPAPSAPPIFGSGQLNDDELARRMRAHLTHQRNERAYFRQLGNPRLRERMQQRRSAPTSYAIAPPQVGDMATFRMQRNFGNYSIFDNVRFRAVYVGSKIIMYEDSLAPLARSMDNEYQRMGQEFDSVIWPVLLNFGNPLVVDSALDNNGHLIALFSHRVNNYVVNGQSNQLLGFVTLCDFLPRIPTTVGGQNIPYCPTSNEAEAFYAIVPNPNGGGFSQTNWRRYMRSTLAHEAKHITSYAERYYRDANIDDLEETWLEEATAQVSSELFSLLLYNRTQLGDVRWADGPTCDYAAISATCPDPFEGILHHYTFLYDAYEVLESKSVVDASDDFADPVIYGYSWAFVRWITDTYFGADQGAFLRSLVQVQNDHGVPNLVARSGHSFAELLGLFSLACVGDNYPVGTIADTRLRFPSWNSRDLFSNMSARLVLSGGQPAFPLPWPLRARDATFGTFSTALAAVNLLRGGGFAAWELSGTQSTPQVLAIRDLNGGLPPPQIGMAIVRVQ